VRCEDRADNQQQCRAFPTESESILHKLRPEAGGNLTSSWAFWLHVARAGFPRDQCDAQRQERQMNWDRVEGNWKQFKGQVKEQWGKLTDDDFDQIAGKRDQLAGKIQERYGIAKDEADRQITDWYDRSSSSFRQ
jgi:uncharacterized protein YjbJ (UPF0337 family)